MSWSSQHWELAWTTAKDLILTGTGVALILSQVWAQSPSDILLATGLALTVPSVASHAKVLLTSSSSGHGPSSSPSSPQPGSSPPGSSSRAADDE